MALSEFDRIFIGIGVLAGPFSGALDPWKLGFADNGNRTPALLVH